ncbi:SurA N-terminal domain-containing protein [uncultured Rikenella sp.]|uniref:SurA N-terminal domain-containing protein n=1 Tax=uncultured Rikenella sp. TaxID=368003 RepID=UPI002623333E|nr:SurA N-terminal domain-containing protein [uncultured Rikenella sp.]
MVTLNTLRNKGGVLLAIVIGLALLAFVLGDMLTSGSTLMNSSKMNVGMIDGEKVSTQEYAQAIDELTEVRRITTGREGSTEEENEMIRVQAWDMMIRDKALKPALTALGLTVSDDEMVGLLSGANPSPIIAQMFADPQTGLFEPALLRQFVANVGQDQTGRMQMFWNYLQGEVADQSLLFKFKNLIDKAAYVTGFEAEQLASWEAKTYSVDYLVSRYESVADSTVQVSDAELREYYDSHEGMFRQEDLRDIEYVTFEALPSADDYAAAEKAVHELAAGLAETGNVQQYVAMNSQSSFDPRYYKPGEMTGELGNFAFSATADQVYGPVLSGDRWTMARIADVQVIPDSMRISNIVIPADRKTLADSLVTALRNGGDFAEAAREFSADPQSGALGGDMGMMDPQTLAPQFAEALKGASEGSVKTVSTPEAVFILKVTGVKGESRKVQLGVIDYNVEASELTRNQVYGEANKFATAAAAGGFEKAVNDGALAKRVATVGPNDRTVGGMQQSRELARWAFNGELGEISDVKEFGNNFVIATITAVREKGVAPFDQVKNDLLALVMREKKGEMLAQRMAGAASVAALAATLGVDTLSSDDINFQGFMAPEVGFDPAFTGGVSGIGKTGAVSKPIVGRIGVYAAEITAERETPVDQAIEKARLTAEAQQNAFMAAYEAFMTLSDIQDTRYRFY